MLAMSMNVGDSPWGVPHGGFPMGSPMVVQPRVPRVPLKTSLMVHLQKGTRHIYRERDREKERQREIERDREMD